MSLGFSSFWRECRSHSVLVMFLYALNTFVASRLGPCAFYDRHSWMASTLLRVRKNPSSIFGPDTGCFLLFSSLSLGRHWDDILE
jgi:hypothetical protein